MFDNVTRLITLCTILQHSGSLRRGKQGVPEVHDTWMASSVSSISASRDALTVSDQHVGKRAVFPTPPVDLYRPHECHYDHNEVEDHDTAPGHCQTLGRAVSAKGERLIIRRYSRHALTVENEERRYQKYLNLN
jgi:hypothetical protein